ncbi:MAG: hypothetical protein F6K14_25165 [Symploca sp. SIO2C1]|nr:hypothetical protein [Symploca sp. SIO2C1]
MVSEYIFSGSLPESATTYVTREADDQLYDGLKSGKFCYVLNSRQTGKSSLRVRTLRRLTNVGFACAAIDLSFNEVQGVSPEQWYVGLIDTLIDSFALELDLEEWWYEHQLLSALKRFRKFIEEVLLVEITQQIVIFIDEIDSVLSLNFPTDDFFAFIRACHNQRADNPQYNRLNFCLLGVASPSNLIEDKKRTPFNIGQAIMLAGFQLHEVEPLLKGLSDRFNNPHIVIQEILDWTGGQPFLTQKLCQLMVCESEKEYPRSVDQVVREKIIDNWEASDQPEHLRTIRNRLLSNEERTGRWLGLYQQILQQGEIIADDSLEQTELRLSGLVVKQQGKLKVYNQIYRAVFNQIWVDKQLASLRPYSEAINAWLASNREDESRLLRGQALQDALKWKAHKMLSVDDDDFLAASLEIDRLEMQSKLKTQQQRVFLVTVSTALLVAIILGLGTFFQYRKAVISEILALTKSAEVLFTSNQRLDALLKAIRAKRQLQKLQQLGSAVDVDSKRNLERDVERVLGQAVYGVVEYNHLLGHKRVFDVAFSPKGDMLASASDDNTIKLWNQEGKLLQTIEGHEGWVYGVAISPDGKTIASVGEDQTVKLWNLDGSLRKTLKGHTDEVWGVAISTDGKIIASASADKTIKLWNIDGTPRTTLKGHSEKVWGVAISPDGKTIASASADNTVKLWNINGTLKNTLQAHQGEVIAVAISSNGQMIASASQDKTVKLWNSNGTLLKTLEGHTAPVYGVAISPDGKTIVSASADKTIKLWSNKGTLFNTLEGHRDRVWEVAISPDGKTIASGSWDKTIKLWKTESSFLTTLSGHTDVVIGVDLSPDAKTIASASDDKTVRLWNQKGTLLKTIKGHKAEVYGVSFSPDGKTIASSSKNKTIKLWNFEGEELKTFRGHTDEVWGVSFSPDGKTIVSGSGDKTVRLWNIGGSLGGVSEKKVGETSKKTRRHGDTETRRIEIPTQISLTPLRVTLKKHREKVWAVSISPDSQMIASASEDKTVKLWSKEGTLLKTLEGHRDAVNDVAIDSANNLIVSASSDGTAKLWSSEGNLLHTLQDHQQAVKGVSISPDGEMIATASADKTVKIWGRDGKLLKTLSGHNGGVWGVSFSHDGQILASASEDKTVILWKLEDILNLNELNYGCNWVKDYLKYNAKEEDHNLCD